MPRFPQAKKTKPLVVHAPSHKTKKGTETVLNVMCNLSRTHGFDFKLIHETPRKDALELVAKCDVFLYQFTIGAEGLVSLEAMVLGKPAVCFIKPSLLPRYPADLPTVVADQHTLEEAIVSLLKDGARRHAIGRQSRSYVEDYHDARKIGSDLTEICSHLSSKSDSAARRDLTATCRSWHDLRPERAELGAR